MHRISFSSALRRAFVTCLGALILILTGATLAAGQGMVQPDGRINQVAHFGGDAFYCVDSSFISTPNYPEMIDGGGFRLLNSGGQELWFVPAADILAAITESLANETAVLVAEGQGTYGPVRLYTYFDGNAQQFVFSGYDEFGKTNSLTFVPCTPVGPIPQEPSSEELCTLVTVTYVPYQGGAKRVAPVMGGNGGYYDETTRQIPCDECPDSPKKLLAGKRPGAVAALDSFSFCEGDGRVEL